MESLQKKKIVTLLIAVAIVIGIGTGVFSQQEGVETMSLLFQTIRH